jgi:hypothetical protein
MGGIVGEAPADVQRSAWRKGAPGHGVRLFLAEGDPTDALRHLALARTLVEEPGYHRRARPPGTVVAGALAPSPFRDEEKKYG